MSLSLFDIVIIGAGIGGLNTADQLQQKYPKKNILLCDLSDKVGGRVQSIKKDKTILESGAARFNNYHKLLLSLIKRFKLTNQMIEIPSGWETRTKPKKTYSIKFKNVDELINYLVKKAPQSKFKDRLNDMTFGEYCLKELDKNHLQYLQDYHPYYSEIKILNCLQAIKVFKEDLNEQQKFYMLSGGLSQITRKLLNAFKKNGGKVKLNHMLTDIKTNSDNIINNNMTK